MPVSVRRPGLQAQGSRCRAQAVQEGAVSRTAGLLPLTLHPHLCLEAAFAQGPHQNAEARRVVKPTLPLYTQNFSE